jgi:hypothetical protein
LRSSVSIAAGLGSLLKMIRATTIHLLEGS